MGWSFNAHSQTKESYISEILDGFNCPVLDYSVRGNHLWILLDTVPVPIIALALLGSQRGCWGHTLMEESCGPDYYDCPLKFLKRAPEPQSFNLDHRDSGQSWRHFVRNKRAKATA
jgi:hypothetical protein